MDRIWGVGNTLLKKKKMCLQVLLHRRAEIRECFVTHLALSAASQQKQKRLCPPCVCTYRMNAGPAGKLYPHGSVGAPLTEAEHETG